MKSGMLWDVHKPLFVNHEPDSVCNEFQFINQLMPIPISEPTTAKSNFLLLTSLTLLRLKLPYPIDLCLTATEGLRFLICIRRQLMLTLYPKPSPGLKWNLCLNWAFKFSVLFCPTQMGKQVMVGLLSLPMLSSASLFSTCKTEDLMLLTQSRLHLEGLLQQTSTAKLFGV